MNNTELKIGFDAKRAFCNFRGLGNYSRDTIRILSEQSDKNKYYLFTPKTKDTISFPINKNCEIIEPHGVFSRMFSFAWRTFEQCKEIKKRHLDIYHGLSHELPYGIEKCGVKTVVTMHDVIFLKNPELFPFFDRYTFRKKYVRSCLLADRVIAISEQTKRDLIEYIGVDEQKIDVVYQGCNPVFHRKPLEEEKQAVAIKYKLPSDFMLIVSAIEKRKNHEAILKAIHIGKIELPLVIVGRPSEYKNELMRLISEYDLRNQIYFLHDVKTEDLPAIYNLAKLFVYPSFFEGFGIPILEALTSGLPVITSKGSCFEETGGDAAYYVSPDNPEELAHAISKILNDSDFSEQMIIKGYRHAAIFSEETIAKTLMQTYQKVLSDNS